MISSNNNNTRKSRDEQWKDEMQKIYRAIITVNVNELRELAPFMKRHINSIRLLNNDCEANDYARSNKKGVILVTTPLAVLLERLKLSKGYLNYSSNDTDDYWLERWPQGKALNILIRDAGADPNGDFEVLEKRPLHLQYVDGIRLISSDYYRVYRIKSNPLSWFFYVRHGDYICNDDNRQLHYLRCLLLLGADPNIPFRFELESDDGASLPSSSSSKDLSYSRKVFWEKTIRNDAQLAERSREGYSLLSMILSSEIVSSRFITNYNLDLFKLFLEFGARFNSERDPPAPFLNAISRYDVGETVDVFYRYWQTGQITTQDILAMDVIEDGVSDGDTAMHFFAIFPPREGWEEALQKMLDMGFSYNTLNRQGITVLAHAEEFLQQNHPLAADNPARIGVIERLRLLHAREMSMQAFKTLRYIHRGSLPREVRGAIASFLPHEIYPPDLLDQAPKAEQRIIERVGQRAQTV